MDFKQETDFREADRRYAHLVRQRQAGGISEEDFEVQRQVGGNAGMVYSGSRRQRHR